MRLLITGIGGFVGRHMADYAVAQGATVVGINRMPGAAPGVEFLVADLDSTSATADAVKAAAAEAVIHLAAHTPANRPHLPLRNG